MSHQEIEPRVAGFAHRQLSRVANLFSRPDAREATLDRYLERKDVERNADVFSDMKPVIIDRYGHGKARVRILIGRNTIGDREICWEDSFFLEAKALGQVKVSHESSVRHISADCHDWKYTAVDLALPSEGK